MGFVGRFIVRRVAVSTAREQGENLAKERERKKNRCHNTKRKTPEKLETPASKPSLPCCSFQNLNPDRETNQFLIFSNGIDTAG